ncbi:MAG: very short patch repair endonuclease [Sandaracinus sp.]|nr:very short patch repair endonuclease [Sandaracinus sp.]
MSRDHEKPSPPDALTQRRMKRTRRSDTAAEVAIRRLVFARGLRYRKDYKPVTGLRTRADVAFIGPRVLVYVNGCFWHGCPQHATWPKKNAAWWRAKIEANMARDARIDKELREHGWTVLRIWEHEPPEAAAKRILKCVRKYSGE